MPAFGKHLFYPVKLGDVFNARYQVLSKLGFGANSTVWFCRDLREHRYIALKIYIHESEPNREVQVLEYLSTISSDHPGRGLIRTMLDSFEIDGPAGRHRCIVHEPLLVSLLHFQATLVPTSLPEDLLKGALQQLLLGLDYLHTEAHVIHTDIQAKNIMISAKDIATFQQWAERENTEPSARKIDGDHIIYLSQRFRRSRDISAIGVPILSDFGEARVGDVQDGIIQPNLYRAPEVLLGMKWTSKVDIWNVGTLIWDLFEDHHLFDGGGSDRGHSDAHLLAEMLAVLGPPALQFLSRCKESRKYWDETGNWKGLVDVPRISLEDSEEYLEGANKKMFMDFIRKMLQWDPNERLSARELLMDPWLNN